MACITLTGEGPRLRIAWSVPVSFTHVTVCMSKKMGLGGLSVAALQYGLCTFPFFHQISWASGMMRSP